MEKRQCSKKKKKADAFTVRKENVLAKLKHPMCKSREDPVGFLEQLIQVSIRGLLTEGQKMGK